MLKKAVFLMVLLEGLSLLSFVYPKVAVFAFVAVSIAAFFIAFKNLEWGTYLLFGELFFGSRGHLLDYWIGPVLVSVREVIFLAIFLSWLFWLVRQQNLNLKKYLTQFGWQYIFLVIVVILAILHGFLARNGVGNVAADSTAYLFLGILPAVFSAIRGRQQVENLLQILGAAVIVIAAKTLFLFIWFSFAIPGVATLYHWVISQNIGEITGEVGTPSRVFLPSQFYSLIGLFIFAFGVQKKNWLVIASAVLALFLSLSRSFWLGGIAAAGFLAVVYLFRYRSQFWKFARIGVIIVLICILEFGILFALTKIGGGGFSGTLGNRVEAPAQDAAASARLLLLPELLKNLQKSPLLGLGMGFVVSYPSFLPDKITPANPYGEISGYRFEWGYLDLWLKLGFLGLVIYLLFIANIFERGWRAWQNSQAVALPAGILAGLAALLILNLTTPFLNHPLGIGFLVFAVAIFAIGPEEQSI